ncbi:MAG: hypothetical protein PWQ57_1492 [Desulfovibrionales bacterium]|nr:hypothetical protein [Desulfovibrionales bacterium]
MSVSNLAAPSFLWPGTVAENCRWIAQRLPEVSEVGVCLFESEACLAYGEADLPAWLPETGLRFHLHLPLDLPWERGFDAGFAVIRKLLEKCARLSPWAAVLHPPPPDMLAAAARAFEAAGWAPGRVLIENVKDCDLTEIWPQISRLGFGVCLDVGHALKYGQDAALALPGLFRHTRMLHLHGAGAQFSHASMLQLSERGQNVTAGVLAQAKEDAVKMIEVFDPEGYRESAVVLEGLLCAPKLDTEAFC